MPSPSPECTTKIYTYQSLCQRYSGNKSPDLQLTVHEYGKDSIELELTNLQYALQRYQKIKHICINIIIYIVYIIMVSKNVTLLKGHMLCDLSCLLWLLYRIFNLMSLIHTEKVIICLDLALQCHTVRFLRRTSNLFIPASNIYDIVINEVIEDLDVHYILIIRTKGSLFQKKPIITLFNSLQPSFECLQMTYRCLNGIFRKSNGIR
ncbi:PREDICTED: uncharacterized protein LOC108974091 [Bactrocera latifrons]|uniref:Phosphatidylinositol N-acetylglucosaminyltransferase subunit H conserved domain-containing protein n=1 Tax=Bactrocera latifrons TaxID=174628 RepID=A0A0K8UZS3_BACLA|nr:PREDICTED: uncharacterized protein LOC108974091 [Bactrocera latifrons]